MFIKRIKASCQKQGLIIVAATALFFSSNLMAAGTCAFINGTNQQVVNFGVNIMGGFAIPKDAPIGTVVYEEVVTVPAQSFYCPDLPSYLVFILNPALGNVSGGSTFPLGNSGMSFRLYTNDRLINREEVIGQANTDYPYRNLKMQIFKSGNLVSQNIVPAGYIGVHGVGGLDLFKVNLLKPIILNSASCQSPGVSVNMGDDYELGEFIKAGDTSRDIKFNIALNQCEASIQKVTYSLQATSQIVNRQEGVVALNPSSTAKGIGLKLMGEDGKPIVLGSTYRFYGFNTTDKNFKIPLSAAFYRLPNSTLEAGTANASVTFTVSYL